MIVLDTNVALDLLVFDDPRCAALAAALDTGARVWIATRAMREEFARVLAYPKIAQQLVRVGRPAPQVLAAFDARVHLRDAWPVPRADTACRCKDPDDQIFIDLALAYSALLLSKDRAVLSLMRPLARQGVRVLSVLPPAFS
ncbi:MAG: PIN domain-containing protein [Burkholderiaceae bacterium]|jgi:predicted nucleic acid-binding protein|nr:PIN domain-containing protein [Burkholderiaceae bacterium]